MSSVQLARAMHDARVRVRRGLGRGCPFVEDAADGRNHLPGLVLANTDRIPDQPVPDVCVEAAQLGLVVLTSELRQLAVGEEVSGDALVEPHPLKHPRHRERGEELVLVIGDQLPERELGTLLAALFICT